MFLLRLFIVALALLIATEVVPGVTVSSLYIAMIVAVLLAVLNVTARPIMVFLTLPLTVITLGIFLFVINAAILMFLASFIDGFTIASFWSALLLALWLTVINGFAHWILRS